MNNYRIQFSNINGLVYKVNIGAKHILFIFLFSFTFLITKAQYIIHTFAGGAPIGLGDGGAATNAHLVTPSGICIDRYGNVYISDQNDCRIRKIDVSGIITTVAGSGPAAGYSGDNGPADSAKLNWPEGVAVDQSGTIYIADNNNNVIRKVVDGFIYTIAGNGTIGPDSTEGIPATNASLWHPADVGVDYIGNVYFVDQNNHRAKKIDTTGMLTTIAGNGIPGFSGDGGPATNAMLNFPEGIGVDSMGNVFIADLYNTRVRRVDAITGIITTVAGCDSSGYFGDGGPATDAWLYDASAVALDHHGNIYITDLYNYRIRKVDSLGIISTVAGSGIAGFGGDGGPATAALLSSPQGVAADDSGNVYIADYENFRVRKVSKIPLISASIISSPPEYEIYPNPNDGVFTLQTNQQTEKFKVIISNSVGEVVYINTLFNNTELINLSNQNNGVYFIKLYFNEFVLTRRISIVK